MNEKETPLHWAIQLRRILLIGHSQGTTREELVERIEKHNAFLRDVTGLLEIGGPDKAKPFIEEYFRRNIATPDHE
jgi:hypothetical protein